jgi:PEP-CTERM motif
MRTLMFLMALLVLTTLVATAGTICPGGNSTNFVTLSPSISGATGHDPDPTGTGCNTLITINANLTATVTIPDSIPYEGVEDNLVGVLNNSSIVITSLTLTGTDIFGLDGDGICLFTWAAAAGVPSSSYCSSLPGATTGTDPRDYFGPTTSSFAITNANSGTVFFGAGIAAGSRTYFSLEQPPNAALQVIPGTGVPEPGTLALACTGFAGFWLYRRRRSAVKRL